MELLQGTFDKVSIDDKGRFSLPSSIRSALPPESENTFIIVRGTEGCLFAYPKNEWQRIFAALKNLPITPDNVRRRRRITDTLRETKLDTQGRATLTQNLKALAGIENELTIVGDGDKLELWNSSVRKRELEVSAAGEDYNTAYYRAMGEIGRNRNGD